MEEKDLFRIEIWQLAKLETTALIEPDDSAIPLVRDTGKYVDDTPPPDPTYNPGMPTGS